MVTNLDVLPKFKEIIIKNAESVLDVGCGGTTYTFDAARRELIKTYKGMQPPLPDDMHDWWCHFNCKKKVGIDIWEPEIKWRKEQFPNDTFYIMNAMKMDEKFEPKSFDIVHCQNVVEHLNKDKAIELIKKMEKIAKKQVILGTPKGFRENPEESRNPYEKHRCEFTKKELESLGYTVIEFSDYYLCYKNLVS